MPETRPYIPWDVITNFMKDAFMGYGVPERDAEICTDVLVESDRRGIERHGCNRFKPIYIDRFEQGILNPVTNIEVLRETPAETACFTVSSAKRKLRGSRTEQSR